MQILVKLRIIDNKYIYELKESIIKLKQLSCKYAILSSENKSLNLAKKLYNNNIIIYGTDKMKAVSYRFKSQLSENAKILSFFHYLPEMNHNEIESFSNLINNSYSLIWLVDESEDKRIRKRINITSKIISKIQNQYFLKFTGETLLIRQYQSVYFLDWVSYYLALHYRTNPTSVEKIEKLKNMLNKWWFLLI